MLALAWFSRFKNFYLDVNFFSILNNNSVSSTRKKEVENCAFLSLPPLSSGLNACEARVHFCPMLHILISIIIFDVKLSIDGCFHRENQIIVMQQALNRKSNVLSLTSKKLPQHECGNPKKKGRRREWNKNLPLSDFNWKNL
jgi:hypothetical protein